MPARTVDPESVDMGTMRPGSRSSHAEGTIHSEILLIAPGFVTGARLIECPVIRYGYHAWRLSRDLVIRATREPPVPY